ncbi:MAG: hypothetical protein NTW82_03740, partial [Bacteroidia bacterium]|nr:hypothetical protein [Bacteroidia bacterium]
MSTSFDNLRRFFDQVKEINLWKRIFNWRAVKALSYDAYEEFSRLSGKIDDLNQFIDERDKKVNDLEKSNEGLKIKVQEIVKLENKIEKLEGDLNRSDTNKNEFLKKVTQFEQTEATRKNDYEKNVAAVNAIREALERERKKLHDDRIKEQEEEFDKMKDTWKNHQDNVQSTIKNICLNHQIEYVDKVPFKGNPDNTI